MGRARRKGGDVPDVRADHDVPGRVEKDGRPAGGRNGRLHGDQDDVEAPKDVLKFKKSEENADIGWADHGISVCTSRSCVAAPGIAGGGVAAYHDDLAEPLANVALWYTALMQFVTKAISCVDCVPR